MIRILHGCYPVNAVTLDGTVIAHFHSIGAGARAYGVSKAAVAIAVARGTYSGGVWWRYADMPPACQPLRPRVHMWDPRPKPVYIGDQWYPNLKAAATAMGLRKGTLHMRLSRQAKRRMRHSVPP
jgi:hypothetical protein